MPAPMPQDAPATLGDGFIGRIPVRNLWLLMLYASDLVKCGATSTIALEDAPDDLPDLVGEILARTVEVRQRRRLTFGYRTRSVALNRVRGRIDVLNTERHQLLARGVVACRCEDMTVDTPRNRYVRRALETIGKVARRPEISHRCRTLAAAMKASGVSGEAPTRFEMSTDRFGRHDADDRFMVAAAKLALDLALPTEAAGAAALYAPNREEAWVRRLFEKAVAGFYDVILTPRGWGVRAGMALSWTVQAKTAGIDRILPSMRTDIVLDHSGEGRRIVIDTKFTSITTSGWYREESLRSGYVYQMYAYLRSQVGSGDRMADRASGLLLHPAIGEAVDETAVIQGHPIRFATVDLTASSNAIRARLLDLCEPTPLP